MPRFKRCTLSVLFIAGLLINGGPRALARKSAAKTTAPNNDQIEVIGHIAFDGTGVTQVMTGEHWRRNYLYLNSGEKIIVVDVTSSGHPSIASEYHHALPATDTQVQVIVGNAVLLAVGRTETIVPRLISVMSFADPAKPTVVRQFTKVTGFLNDSHRGLIYVINNEGLWILNEQPARDLELEEQYGHDVVYNH
jgi:hypothetical protein